MRADLVLNAYKVLGLGGASFIFGLALTPLLTHYLYKYQLWRKDVRTTAPDSSPTPIFNSLHNIIEEESASTEFVDLRHARDESYRKVLEEIIRTGKCPFCPENFKWHANPELHSCGKWFITEATWPYENAKYHFLIIGQDHKDSFEELTPDDLRDVASLVYFAKNQFDIPGAGLALRFGDTVYTGATVKHLHFHLIQPEKGKVVNFPVG